MSTIGLIFIISASIGNAPSGSYGSADGRNGQLSRVCHSLKRRGEEPLLRAAFEAGAAPVVLPCQRAGCGEGWGMRDWPNPLYHGSLEEACRSAPHEPYLERIGLEVEALDGSRRYVLAPAYDVGLPPWSGDETRCSDISFEETFRVVRVAKGFPGAMICGRYPDDFPAGRR